MVFFHNSSCLRCATELGYDPEAGELVGIADTMKTCANLDVARCNWLLPADEAEVLCVSCRLTAVRPNDFAADDMAGFADAEDAKRRLLHQLFDIGLEVVGRDEEPDVGVRFEFLSSRNKPVTTGHDMGVITLDLSESDDAHRAFVRQQLGEPYRTVLGHLRHEIGHWFWIRLVENADNVDEFRALFGDERVSYEDALASHYGDTDADGDVDADDDMAWVENYVSRYATMHPWEDWAETFAHYLHIRAGVDTAESFGLLLGNPVRAAAREAFDVDDRLTFGDHVEAWLALTLALNGMSRAIGQDDLYPFVLSERVIEKLDMVHRFASAAAPD